MTNFPPMERAPSLGALEEYKILPGWQNRLAETANTPEFWKLWSIALEESAKGVDTM